LLQSLNHSLEESLNNGHPLNGSHSVSNQNSLQHAIDISDISELAEMPNHSFLVTTQSTPIENNVVERKLETSYVITMKAPTAPGRKLDEETLTWLNQGQPYEIVMFCSNPDKYNPGQLIKGIISLGFHERQYQYFECEKYDEWVINRPNEKIIDLDIPMCFGIQNVNYVGAYTNEIEFQFDPFVESKIFCKVNCLSSDFMKNKSGSSGVLLRLQIEIIEDSLSENNPLLTAGCQIKVFRAKGANRKLKLEREKHEGLSKKDAEQVQPSCDVTIFNMFDPLLSLNRKSSEASISTTNDLCGISPTSSQLDRLNLLHNSSASSICSIATTPRASLYDISFNDTLSANLDVQETQQWLTYNRFHNYLQSFANFTGADLLRLSRSDLIQVCGPADGIRLNNAIQARASRPLLTMYVSPEWHQSESGMREYHAMFLEQLTVEDLKKKLAKKCCIEENKIAAILKQGPTGIHIHIDDDVVRNFVDEAHHVVEVVKDPLTGMSKMLLK